MVMKYGKAEEGGFANSGTAPIFHHHFLPASSLAEAVSRIRDFGA
jgi:hypothetical protein